MQEEFEKLVNEQLEYVLDIVGDVFDPPPGVFRQYCHAAFGCLIYKGEDLEKSKAEFDALCLAIPHTPRDAITCACLAYTGLELCLEDKKGFGDIGAAKAVQTSAFLLGNSLGHIIGSAKTSLETQKVARRIMAQQGAFALHTENRAEKKYVFEWMDENFKTGMKLDDVALLITGKHVNAKFRAVRDWITEWKKLRSASTP